MFITFEGPDGSGKTTALHKLVDYLQFKGANFVLTREPGSAVSKENQKIRELIVSNETVLSDMAEAILFAADRRLHLERLIWPSLKEGKIVICDRYVDSTYAYQGAGRGLGIDKMIELQELITEKTYPTFTFYFKLPVEEALKRVDTRGEKNRLDNESIEFVKRVHDGYDEIIKRWPERFIIIDASKSPEEVFAQVKQEFEKRVQL